MNKKQKIKIVNRYEPIYNMTKNQRELGQIVASIWGGIVVKCFENTTEKVHTFSFLIYENGERFWTTHLTEKEIRELR